jgi:hypothetical protein
MGSSEPESFTERTEGSRKKKQHTSTHNTQRKRGGREVTLRKPQSQSLNEKRASSA